MAVYKATFQSDPNGDHLTLTYAFGRLTVSNVGDAEHDEKDAGLPADRAASFRETREHAGPILGRYPNVTAAKDAVVRHYDNLDIWFEEQGGGWNCV